MARGTEITPATDPGGKEKDLVFYQEAAETLLEFYPHTTPTDIYIKTLRETLLHFGQAITEKLVHPVTGIVSTSKFLPSLSEIHDFVNPPPSPKNERIFAPLRFPPEKEYVRDEKNLIPPEAFEELQACIKQGNPYSDMWVKLREKWGLSKWAGPPHQHQKTYRAAGKYDKKPDDAKPKPNALGMDPRSHCEPGEGIKAQLAESESVTDS